MKEIITRFRYENLRNEAHVQLHENFTALVINHDAETLGIKPLYDRYAQAFAQEKEALDMILKSGLTDEILAQDAKRDRLFRGFADAVKAYLNHYEEEKCRMAGAIQLIVSRYGNIAARPLDEETAAIDDLCRELLKPQPFVYLTELGLDKWPDYLEDANRTFGTMMQARYHETALRPNINMRSTRVAVDKLFRALLDLLEALVLVHGEAKYVPFIAELNAIMQRYEHILAQEKGMREPITN